jgi:hypothetical protein
MRSPIERNIYNFDQRLVNSANVIRHGRSRRKFRFLLKACEALQVEEATRDSIKPQVSYRRARKQPYLSMDSDFNPNQALIVALEPLRDKLEEQEYGTKASADDLMQERIRQFKRYIERDRQGALTGAMRRFGRKYREEIWQLQESV